MEQISKPIDDEIIPVQKKKRSLKNIVETKLWMICKLSKIQRTTLRDARKELQVIIKRSRALSFDYIVCREKPAKICFGSGMQRSVIPLEGSGQNSLMKRINLEARQHPGPGAYELKSSLLKKYPKRTGYTGLASTLPRLPIITVDKIPPVGTYDYYKSPIKPHCKPFGIGQIIRKVTSSTPGPGTYLLKGKSSNVAESFGAARKIIPTVQTICAPINLSFCRYCEKVPLGDYFHCFKTKEDICRPCMKAALLETKACGAKLVIKIKKLREFEKFSRVRYCGFYHDHNGTTASIKLMSKRDLKHKLTKENYLSLYYM